MAKKRIHRRGKKRNRKMVEATTHVPLCGLSAVFEQKAIFSPIHQLVEINQKTVDYSPTDKLVFTLIGIVAGAETVSDINVVLRPNKPLLLAFGYDKCADQSVIQDTLNAATETNVFQLEAALKQIWDQQNQVLLQWPDKTDPTPLTVDIDLSPLPTSKRGEKSKKGYSANRKNQYCRQFARVFVPKTDEIVTQSVYAGNTLSLSVFKEMVSKMETALELETQESLRQIEIRIDAGFGTDKNINFALWRGYHLLAKMYSGRRAKKLAKSVAHWTAVPSESNQTQRDAGFVTQPHRYGRKTVQVAVRTKTKKGGYSYSLLVTTRLDASVAEIVKSYDKRCGLAEGSFCQDYQGLRVRKRRKNGFVAQQMLILLSQIAHNLVVWIKHWLVDALQMSLFAGEHDPAPQTIASVSLAVKTIQQRGIKRFLRQILWISGKVVFKKKKVYRISLNPYYPLIDRIKTALEAFLLPYKIRVLLDEN